MGIESYSTTAASNNSAAPNGFPEGMNPSDVNNSSRQVMADLRAWYESAEWINFGHTPTYVSATSFTVSGDHTGEYLTDRRIKIADATTLYGYITSSSYSAPNTTVNVELDSGSVSASISVASLNIISQPLVASIFTRDTFVGDASTTSFALTKTPLTENAVVAYVNGVPQIAGEAFTLSGSNIVFASAPPNVADIEVFDYSPKAVAYEAADASIAEDKIGTGAVTADKIPDASIANSKLVNNTIDYTKINQVTAKKVIGNMGSSIANASEISVLDEDDMVTNSDTALASQQSIKSYIDSKIPTKASSGEITVSSGDQEYSFAHSLSSVPDDFSAFLICKTAELDYSIDDKIKITGEHESAYGIQVYADDINVYFRTDQGIKLNDLTSRDWITYGNWKLILTAIKYN